MAELSTEQRLTALESNFHRMLRGIDALQAAVDSLRAITPQTQTVPLEEAVPERAVETGPPMPEVETKSQEVELQCVYRDLSSATEYCLGKVEPITRVDPRVLCKMHKHMFPIAAWRELMQ